MGIDLQGAGTEFGTYEMVLEENDPDWQMLGNDELALDNVHLVFDFGSYTFGIH